MNYGFIRVATAIPELKVADSAYNVKNIIQLIEQADNQQAEIVCFPELSLSSYSCSDLFFQQQLHKDIQSAIEVLQAKSKHYKPVIIVGTPIIFDNQIFNCAVIIQNGVISGIVPKSVLGNMNGLSEKRWFSEADQAQLAEIELFNQKIPFGTDLIFKNSDFSFAIEIGQDLWSPNPPSTQHAQHGAEIIFNLSAQNELAGKYRYVAQLIEQQSARSIAAYVYSSAGYGESTTDIVFGGNAMIAEQGKMIAQSARFSTQAQLIVTEIDVEKIRAERLKNSLFKHGISNKSYRTVHFEKTNIQTETLKRVIDRHPFIPSVKDRDERCAEIYSIQVSGLAKRWQHTQAQTLIIGISGGLDSTLALLVCVGAADLLGYDRSRIVGVTMPGFGTTKRTYQNAIQLMNKLHIQTKEISIEKACLQHFEDIGHDPDTHDITYENSQARERTQILMDMANRLNGLVVGTGDLSELALGWATYNGDHISMYGVNSNIPKTLVRYLVDWLSEKHEGKTNSILQDILATPVSPELLPSNEQGEITQMTEGVVGPYELHDFFLYYFIRFGFSPKKILYLAKNAFYDTYTDEIIVKWLKVFIRRFFQQQFKRSCMPDGPKVGSVGLSPRGDWQMPSDAIAWDISTLE